MDKNIPLNYDNYYKFQVSLGVLFLASGFYVFFLSGIIFSYKPHYAFVSGTVGLCLIFKGMWGWKKRQDNLDEYLEHEVKIKKSEVELKRNEEKLSNLEVENYKKMQEGYEIALRSKGVNFQDKAHQNKEGESHGA
ncbi:MAG: hypothetical protein GOV00_03595 [Candidatus Altiarchaeota archaeon]|nr:hypothetical protein [Candidatus Altiarchaeota archaeon]